MNYLRRIFVLSGLLALLTNSARANPSEEIDPHQFEQDLAAIAHHSSRVVGSDGYQQTADYLRKQIAALPNVELKEQSFDVMMPVTERADLTLADGRVVKVYPFWPASVRANTTPTDGINRRLVYVGKAAFATLKPKELEGQIAVVESTAGADWTQAAYFGARAILILENPPLPGRNIADQTSNIDLRYHEIMIPLNIPRFYLPDDAEHHALLEELRANKIQDPARLYAKVSWKKTRATNFYALVRSPQLAELVKTSPTAQWTLSRTMSFGPVGWQQTTNPAALMISVNYEATSLVPDLAPGASQAVQAASGLALLRNIAKHPWNRPVVLFFGGADSQQFAATRQMLATFADPPNLEKGWNEQLKTLGELETVVEKDLKRAHELNGDPSRLNPTSDRTLIDRIVRLIETQSFFSQDELFRLRRLVVQDSLTLAQIAHLDAMQNRLSALGFAIKQNPAALSTTPIPSTNPSDAYSNSQRQSAPTTEAESLLPTAREFLQQAIGRMDAIKQDYSDRRQQLEQRVALYRWLANALQRNPESDPHSNNNRLIEMQVALDLSDGGPRFGPMSAGSFTKNDSMSMLQDWREWFNAQKTKEPGGWFDSVREFVDLSVLEGAESKQSWLATKMPLPTELTQNWGVPAFTFMTLDDLRVRRDTPLDKLESVKIATILPQLTALQTLLQQAWEDPKLVAGSEFRWERSLGVEGQVVSPAMGRQVPDLPRPGFLATYYYADVTKMVRIRSGGTYLVGMRHGDLVPCDAEGHYSFEEIPIVIATQMTALAVEAFRFNADGSVNSCTDLGKQTGDIKIAIDIREEPDPLRTLVFDCQEFSLVGLYDPRFLHDLNELTMLDQRRNAEPQRFNNLTNGPMIAGYVEPEQRTSLLFRFGRVGNRLILLNTKEPTNPEAASGFTAEGLNNLRCLAKQTSRDFYNINEYRDEDYRKAGVFSDVIDTMQQESQRQMRDADAAMAQNDGQGMMNHLTGAWANQARVYSATRDMADDVIHAAIFLLLLCMPFSFCMERLLIGSPSVYKQLTGMGVIFSIMAAALWAFHPAFKISASPLIIILAFGIILMSIVVMGVLYGKFDTELKRIRSGRGTAMSTSFARTSVLMSAVLLGIANMRKRKFRTALTCITIVLITFAVLCFTSASRYLDTKSLPAGVARLYYGLMLRQRGMRPMASVTTANVARVLAEKNWINRDNGNGTIIEQWWNLNVSDFREKMHIRHGSTAQSTKVFAADALLGLSPGASRLYAADDALNEVIEGRKPSEHPFSRLEKGEEQIIYLPKEAAATLGVSIGDKVSIGGIELEVAGLYDSGNFDLRISTLAGDAITPLNLQQGMMDAGGMRLDDTRVDALNMGDDTAGEMHNVYEHLSSSQIAIVPAAISKILPNGTLRSLAVQLDRGDVDKVSKELTKRIAMAMFTGSDRGVEMVASSNLSKVSGAGQVAIPLAIAGLIIFNTMMGSIAERRREIHVYTSLGLAPLHVGALFVAEAMTYGLIGTVFGYVIGQAIGTFMPKAWLGGATLNYSGTSAMMTMGLVLLIVLLSALVPARLASKIAAPSIERTWRVPIPKDGQIMARLPFTINRTAADGVLAYLDEYFAAHQEGSIGKFSAGKVEFFNFEDEAHRKSRGLKTIVWLTPFDLGVRQHLMLLIHPSVEFDDIYEVQVILERMSGDDGSWYRMNRTFLTELRKQFLQWRSLTPQRMMEYVEESKRVLARPTENVVTTLPGEEVRLA